MTGLVPSVPWAFVTQPKANVLARPMLMEVGFVMSAKMAFITLPQSMALAVTIVSVMWVEQKFRFLLKIIINLVTFIKLKL